MNLLIIPVLILACTSVFLMKLYLEQRKKNRKQRRDFELREAALTRVKLDEDYDSLSVKITNCKSQMDLMKVFNLAKVFQKKYADDMEGTILIDKICRQFEEQQNHLITKKSLVKTSTPYPYDTFK